MKLDKNRIKAKKKSRNTLKNNKKKNIKIIEFLIKDN